MTARCQSWLWLLAAVTAGVSACATPDKDPKPTPQTTDADSGVEDAGCPRLRARRRWTGSRAPSRAACSMWPQVMRPAAAAPRRTVDGPAARAGAGPGGRGAAARPLAPSRPPASTTPIPPAATAPPRSGRAGARLARLHGDRQVAGALRRGAGADRFAHQRRLRVPRGGRLRGLPGRPRHHRRRARCGRPRHRRRGGGAPEQAHPAERHPARQHRAASGRRLPGHHRADAARRRGCAGAHRHRPQQQLDGITVFADGSSGSTARRYPGEEAWRWA